MKKFDLRSLLFGAALGLAPLAALLVASLTATDADAQLFRRAVKIQPAQIVCEQPCETVVSVEGKVPPARPVFPGTSDQWNRGFDASWIAAEKERHFIKPHADNKAIHAIEGSQKEGHTYGNYTAFDALLWEKETERLVVEGSLIFHDAELLGSTNGVSCDMCHPDAEGTHAETYPKYQVQLGRAALLRDMANWCLTQPCRGTAMSGDDPRMRALEAYMQAQRTGKPMKYGKH